MASILALNVINAFNSISWNKIVDALANISLPKYLHDLIRAYLSN